MMHILSRSRLAAFWNVHSKAKSPMTHWHNAVEKATFTCFADVKKLYNRSDAVGEHVVFDVNSFRIITKIRYQARRVYIIHVLTHAEYEEWTKAQRGKK